MSQSSNLNIAPRIDASKLVYACIIGGPVPLKHLTLDVSNTGIALRALEEEVRFRIGTIIEIHIPLKHVENSEKDSITVMGRVVRVEQDLMSPDNGKVLCGVHLVALSKSERQHWEFFVEQQKKENEKSESKKNYLFLLDHAV